jgi:hypothetical protein
VKWGNKKKKERRKINVKEKEKKADVCSSIGFEQTDQQF